MEVEIFIENNSTNDKMRYGKTNLLLFAMVFIGLVVIFSYGMGNVSAAGNIVYVNASSGLDTYDGLSPVHTGTGTTGPGPKATIKNATGTVITNGTLNIADGQYTGPNNTQIAINNNMTIKGESQKNTIINGTGTYWIFKINPGITLNIQNLTLTNGNTATYGGAIWNEGTLNVTGSTFTGNTAEEAGAIWNTGTLNVTSSTFTGNYATYNGGAIYNGGGILNVTGSNFNSNTAADYNGGAISNAGTLTVDNSNFTGNTATYGVGGAIYNDGTLDVNSSTFTSNSAAAPSSGGAIYNDGNNIITVTGSTFNGNNANEYGGAIYNNGGTSLTPVTISSCTFGSNGNTTTNEGGAIYNDNSGILNVTDSTFTLNTAINGGAIYNSGTLTVIGSTFTLNTAINAGAIANAGTANVHFNRIIGNIASSAGNAIYNNGPTADVSLNWWGSNTGPVTGDLYGTVTSSPWLVLNITANPVTIGNNVYSTITANLLKDNNGNPVSGYFPNGTSVNFTTNLGTITQASTSNGIAQSALNSGLTVGLATVSAILDNQTMTTFVTIKDTIPPKVTANPVGGLYNITKIVTLKISEAGKIYYTLNGVTPTITSTIYKGPIIISKTTVLKYLAVDLAGNLSPVYSQTYKIDKIPPKVLKTTPTNKKTNISRISTIVIKFTENIKNSTYYNKITIKNNAGKIVKLTKTIKGNTLYIKTSKRSTNTWYTVTIPRAAIKDYTSNNLTTTYTFKFKTGK